ncbi:outer membrane protein [Hyphomicrobium sp. 2TAF46]|uniref:outer membrane protein n=1 Tax=Hyphomicrobium sp. 2TAF46 TaxID=3233019 RepID=UPI003F8E46C4
MSAVLCGVQPASADEYRGSLKDGPAIVEGYNWSGFYAGAHVGAVWGDVAVKDIDGGVSPGPFTYSPSGAFGGGTAGYNWQLDRLVVGVEGDLGYMDLSGGTTIPSSDPKYHQNLTLDGGLYGDITGRLGVLVAPATLIYGKGGFAFYDGEAEQATTKTYYRPTGTDTFTGWVVGGGIEHFITPTISIKAEYLHFQFGDQGGSQEKFTTAPVGQVDDGTAVGDKFHNRQSLDADSVKFGLAVHF